MKWFRTEEESYKGYIKQLADNNDAEIYLNKGKLYAEITMNEIFNHCTNIKMCYLPDDDLDFSESLEKFLKRNDTSLSIIIHNENIKNKKIKNLLVDYSYKIKITWGLKMLLNDKVCQYIIGDKKVYRMEDDVKKHSCFGSFNQPDPVKTLEEHFDKQIENKIQTFKTYEKE